MKKLEQALTNQKKQTAPDVPQISGLLGVKIGGVKRVEVPNRNSFVYVRLRNNQSELIQAFNNRVSPTYGLPVKVVRQGNKYSILSVDEERYENNWTSFAPFLPRHGNTHSFDIESGGGSDIVWVYPRQFMPALVLPSGSTGAGSVVVSPYTLKNDNGTWKYVGNTGTASIILHNPSVSTGAIMALVYLDTVSGNPLLLVNSGTVFSSTITGSSQIYPYIPQLQNPNTQIPLAAVRLVTGSNQLSWDNIYDVRQFLHTQPTGSAGLSSISVQEDGVVEGSVSTFNFTGAGVDVSISGSVANISIQSGTSGGVGSGSVFVGDHNSAVLTNSSGALFTPSWLKWGTDTRPYLEFGADVPNKETNAGKMGYGSFGSDDIFHIIGAGSGSNRTVRIDDNLTVGEGITTRAINLSDPSSTYNINGNPHGHGINTGTIAFQNDGLLLGSAPIINAVDILDVSISGSVARMFVNAPNGTAVLGGSVTLTGSVGAYQDTLFSITLPSAGTYDVTADIRGALTGNAGTLWWLTAKLVNTTDASDITSSERIIVLTGVSGQVFQMTCPITWRVTVTGSKVISLHAFRNGTGGASWTTSQILSDNNGRTTLTYTKIA